MEGFFRILSDGVVLFKRNLRAEYEANRKLRDAWMSMEDLYGEYMGCVRRAVPLAVAEQVISSSVTALKLSDASIRFFLGAINLGPLARLGLPRGQSRLQERLDSVFVVPQYYGGVRDANIMFYKRLWERDSGDGDGERTRMPGMYRPGIRRWMQSAVSRLKHIFGVGGREDSAVTEIENYLVPGIFSNINSLDRVCGMCSENGMLDLQQFVSEARGRQMDGDVRVMDIRRTETSCVDGNLETQFEVEMDVEDREGGNNTEVFLARGRFGVDDVDGRRRLQGLTWARL